MNAEQARRGREETINAVAAVPGPGVFGDGDWPEDVVEAARLMLPHLVDADDPTPASPQDVCFAARALTEAGWLRTAEDRAVLDAVDHAVAYHEACLSLAAGPSLEDYASAWDLFLAAMSDLAEARRVAAGGTEAADPPERDLSPGAGPRHRIR